MLRIEGKHYISVTLLFIMFTPLIIFWGNRMIVNRLLMGALFACWLVADELVSLAKLAIRHKLFRQFRRIFLLMKSLASMLIGRFIHHPILRGLLSALPSITRYGLSM